MRIALPSHRPWPGRAVVDLVAACGSSKPSGHRRQRRPLPHRPGSDVLHMAFAADMPDPDPDIFYYTEGNAIVDQRLRRLGAVRPQRLVHAGARTWPRAGR